MVILLDRTAQATTTGSHTSRSLSFGIHAENESYLFIDEKGMCAALAGRSAVL